MTTTTGTKPVRRHGKRCDDEGGYVAVVLALTLSVLILFAGFAVDIGGWYARAAQMQRAADAAALAGVVWMPTFSGSGTTASSVAIATATANGFTTGGSITVTPSPVTGNTRRLRVTITDTSLTQYFSQLAIGSPTITRAATSEYVLPVPLGSPDNTLGNQSNTDTKNLWASISGPYTSYSNGDPYSTKCLVSASNTSCSTNNTEYRTWGYLYTVDVPASGVGKTLTVQVFDAGNYARPNYANVETADNGVVNTSFEMFSPSGFPLDSSTFYDPSISMNSTGSGSIKCTSGGGKWVIADGASSSTYQNNFVTLCSLVVSTAGQYHLQVKSSGLTGIADSGNGWNQFSLKATLSSAPQPQVYGYGDLSLFNNLPNASGNLTATFYLAQIDQVHAGKHIIISLFDPGDGQSGTYTVNLLKPGGVTTGCTYGARGAATSTIGTCAIVTRTSGGSNAYNGLWLDIDIAIPSTYTCTTDCWWKVRYDFTGVQAGLSPNDRTVWAARLVGDPVHLVDAG
jgi:Flp pilus assembly protein TadG